MTLTTSDRLDILDLVTRADIAATRRDATTYVSYFTDDAVLDGAKGEHRGRGAIASAVDPVWAGEGTASTHLTFNTVIDSDDGRPRVATATSTLVILGAGPSFTIHDVTIIVQQVVKTTRGWRIARRTVGGS